jgi:hypothetical protein
MLLNKNKYKNIVNILCPNNNRKEKCEENIETTEVMLIKKYKHIITFKNLKFDIIK